MNDVARMVSTIVIWSILGVIMIALSVLGSDDLTGIALFLVIGAIASMGIVWQHAGKQAEAGTMAEARAKAKRSERLAQRLAEEDLDEEDLVTLEELLEEERATRRLQDN